MVFGLREAGVFGASVALAGGVAYLAWSYASSACGGEKPERRLGQDGGRESRPGGSAGTQVLVLGLGGAGKTSLLHRLATSSLDQDIQPTQGLYAVSISREDLRIEFLEIGGEEALRPYWQKYVPRALVLVFVVDSSSPQLFPLAKRHLHELLASDPDLPLMLLANKQDLPGACSITDVHEALSLSAVGERKVFLIGTHVKKGEAELSSGVQDARDLIIHMVCDDT